MHWEMFMYKKSAATTAHLPDAFRCSAKRIRQIPALRYGAGAGKHALCLAAAHVRKPFARRYYGCGDGGNHGGGNDDALITRFFAKIERQGLPEHDHEKSNQHAVPHA